MIDPLEPAIALARLTGRPGAFPFNIEKWDEVLRYGARNVAFKAGRGTTLQSYATACVNSGFEYGYFVATLGASLLAGRPEVELRQVWDDAERFVRENPPRSQNEVLLAKLEATVSAFPWRGRSGSTDLAVYRYLVGLCKQLYTDEVSCDQRRLAEAVGRERKTVGRALARLEDAGLITRLNGGSGKQAATYRLHPKVSSNDPNTYLRRPLVGIEGAIGVVATNLDGLLPAAWRGRYGLPSGTYDTFGALPRDGSWVTVRQVALARPGALGTQSVRRHLHVLHSAGLACQNNPAGHLWSRVATVDLGKLARQLGTAGELELQHERHERERMNRDRAMESVRRSA